jgi:hypothetical protein
MIRGGSAEGRGGIRRRASVVAVALALLAIASVTVSTIAPAANARPAAPSVASRTTFVPVAGLALGLVGELANNALSFGLDKAFSWVLGEFGLAEENSSDPRLAELQQQMTAVQARLQEIQANLTELAANSKQLRTEMQEASFANLVSQASTIVSRVEKGMSELDYIAHMHADDSTKHAKTEDTLAYIKTYLMGAEQEELAARVSGSAGAHGLIAGAYKLEKEHTVLWTTRNSQTVRQVFNYYQDAQAQLLLLRVEYMHAHPKTYSGNYIATQIAKVRKTLLDQDSLKKVQTSPTIFADTRTGYDWDITDFSTLYAPGTGPRISTAGMGWVYPTESELQNLAKGHESTWPYWLKAELGGALNVPTKFPGVWTSGWKTCFRPTGRMETSTQPCGALLIVLKPSYKYW